MAVETDQVLTAHPARMADQVLTVRELMEVLDSLRISHPQLEARLQAMLLRTSRRRQPQYSLGEVVFDAATRQSFAHGRPLDLTRREAALLEELLRASGQFITKERLADRLYALEDSGSPNALEAAVSRLRRKLAAVSAAVRIETKWGLGYCLVEVTPRDARVLAAAPSAACRGSSPDPL